MYVILLDDNIVGFQKKEEDAQEAVKSEALRKQAELKGDWVDVSLREENTENAIAVVVQQLGRVYNSPPAPVHLVRFERVTSLSTSCAPEEAGAASGESESESESESNSEDDSLSEYSD